MALTVLDSPEQVLPCHLEQGDGGKVVTTELPVVLQDGDRGGDGGGDDDRLERDDIWNMIQSQKPAAEPAVARQPPYVHPLVLRSSSLLSQKSLEICTESLGSETGSDGFSDADGSTDRSCQESDDDDCDESKEVAARAPPPRSFPPPLPSLARRSVGALQMRQHRCDGRLVVEAVPVPSPTLFRAQRRGGRLLLAFADIATPADEEKNSSQEPEEQADEDGHEEEDEEEEVEVVDRGTVVEVKVSAQPQAGSCGGAARVHRSSLVINKFVGAEPLATSEIDATPQQPRHVVGPTTTVDSASPMSGTGWESKVLLTAKRRHGKKEMLKDMRRCGQLSGQLFIWEPWGIATSS